MVLTSAAVQSWPNLSRLTVLKLNRLGLAQIHVSLPGMEVERAAHGTVYVRREHLTAE